MTYHDLIAELERAVPPHLRAMATVEVRVHGGNPWGGEAVPLWGDGDNLRVELAPGAPAVVLVVNFLGNPDAGEGEAP